VDFPQYFSEVNMVFWFSIYYPWITNHPVIAFSKSVWSARKKIIWEAAF